MKCTTLIGNWKMNQSIETIPNFFNELLERTPNLNEKTKKVSTKFAVPFTLMSEASKCANRFNIDIIAQNYHWENKGAFTGEISIPMLQEIDIHGSLVGHSERRQYFQETNHTVAKKIEAAMKSSFQSVLCVGESLEERERGDTEIIIQQQLDIALANAPSLDNAIIAYEPVWAIGTGKAASPEQAEDVHKMMRTYLRNKFDETVANETSILYGGSMNAENIRDLLAQKNIDGGLIGGASLNAESFSTMLTIAQEFMTC